jgi:CxxC motif-containing protein (DUF1111 family)
VHQNYKMILIHSSFKHKMKNKLYLLAIMVTIGSLTACSDKDADTQGTSVSKTDTLSEEWYTGGKLGTVFNTTSTAYEQSTPVVDANAKFSTQFQHGETFFENIFVTSGSEKGATRTGLGPAYIRNSCIACHPGYGHGRRMERYKANDYGNGYLLVITDSADNYVSTLTSMPQTQAIYPYLPPVNESGIHITWKDYTDEYGNKFSDGETYSLIYPEVSIDQDAFNVPMPTNYKVRLEATIGIYGTGLIDAIPDDSIRAQYNKEKQYSSNVKIGKDITESDGTTHPARYTYGLTRGTLQNGPGSNAIWNITNVTRSNRTYNYITAAYATAMSQNKDVQQALGENEETIYNNLMSKSLSPELSDNDYIDFMVWHRGLAVPAARDLDDTEVIEGKNLFNQIGCTACHRPSWTTGNDDYSGDALLKGKLPQYPYQKIWPYSDFLQHRLEMVNNIRTGYCRTTPLWGRGLSEKCTGAGDHLHDMRARNYIEAIMWHGGDAEFAKKKFYNLNKSQRNAIVHFLESI